MKKLFLLVCVIVLVFVSCQEELEEITQDIHSLPVEDTPLSSINPESINSELDQSTSAEETTDVKLEVRQLLENSEISIPALKELYLTDSDDLSDMIMLEINRVCDWYDYDEDGLLDYYEIYRNFTDPENSDSDNDGILDGDWSERSEYAYSIEYEVRLFQPYDLDFINNHPYQEIKIIEENDNWVDVILRVYPYNELKQTLVKNFNWKEDNLELVGQLEPGYFNDWDIEMQEDLIALLKSHGLDPEIMSDIDLVKELVKLFDTSRYGYQMYENFSEIIGDTGTEIHMFDWYVGYDENGNPIRNKETLAGLNRVNDEIDRTMVLDLPKLTSATGYDWYEEDVWRLMGSSKDMFYKKYHGSCTATSMFYANVFQALGIPAKVMPIQTTIDNSGVERQYLEERLNQADMLENEYIKGLLVETYNREISGSNHVTNFVFLGNRWVNVDVAGGAKFDYSALHPEGVIYFKMADYDFYEKQALITQNWLQDDLKKASFLRDDSKFGLPMDSDYNSVGNFAQKIYTYKDYYGINMLDSRIEWVNTFVVSEDRMYGDTYYENFDYMDDQLNEIKNENADLFNYQEVLQRKLYKLDIRKVYLFDNGNPDLLSSSVRELIGDHRYDFFGSIGHIVDNPIFSEGSANIFIEGHFDKRDYELLPTIIKDVMTYDDLLSLEEEQILEVEIENNIRVIIVK